MATIGCVSASARRIGGVTAYASLVCDVGTTSYLKVIPIETQWVDVEIYADYNVKSNEHWNIE